MGWGNEIFCVLVDGLFLLALAVWIIAGVWYDFRSRRLPNRWLLLGALLWGAAAAVRALGLFWPTLSHTYLGSLALVPGIVGALTWFVLYLSAFLWAPESIGAGDVKLALLAGAAVGAHSARPVGAIFMVLAAVVAASLATLLLAVTARIRSSVLSTTGAARRESVAIPHGPPMLFSMTLCAYLAST